MMQNPRDPNSMTKHRLSRTHVWILLVAVLAVAGHGVILYFVSMHIKALSAALVAGVIALVLIKHLGLLAPVLALVRRRHRR